MTDLHVLKTTQDHEFALNELAALFDLDPTHGSPEEARLEVLGALIDLYEREMELVDVPSPVAAIRVRMEDLGLRQRDLIPMIGTRSRVSEVLAGKRQLSLPMIRALHVGLNLPLKALIGEPEQTSNESDTLNWDQFPELEILKRGWIDGSIEEIKKFPGRIAERFFSPLGSAYPQPALLKRTFYERAGRAMDSAALVAWSSRVLQRAEKEFQGPQYSAPEDATEALASIAKLSCLTDGPIQAIKHLAKIGVAVIVEPHLPGTYLDGGALLHPSGMPVIGITLRHDRLDNFWFTLLHELAHVFLHISKDTAPKNYLDDLDIEKGNDPQERQADKAARDAFIPKSFVKSDLAFRSPSVESATALAFKLGVHPAVVAGRVRYEMKNFRILNNIVGHRQVRCLFSDLKWKR